MVLTGPHLVHSVIVMLEHVWALPLNSSKGKLQCYGIDIEDSCATQLWQLFGEDLYMAVIVRCLHTYGCKQTSVNQ